MIEVKVIRDGVLGGRMVKKGSTVRLSTALGRAALLRGEALEVDHTTPAKKK